MRDRRRAARGAPCTGAGSARRGSGRRRARRGRGSAAPPSAGRRTRHTSGRSSRCLLHQLAERRRRSPRSRSRTRSPSERWRCARVLHGSRLRSELLHDLDDRPVSDPLAVREAPAARRPSRRRRRGTRGQARLSDARRSEHREELAGAVWTDAGRRRPASSRQLACSRPTRARRAGGASPSPSIATSRYASTGSAFPFSSSGGERSASTASRTRRERRAADEHLARRRRLLEPGRDVDRVAGDEPLAGAGDDLAGVHADPPSIAELGQRVAHLDRRAHRAQRVVLVHCGTPKTAITASPMNFSTVPPWRSTIPLVRSK